MKWSQGLLSDCGLYELLLAAQKKKHHAPATDTTSGSVYQWAHNHRMVYREANPPHRRGHGEEGSDSWVPQVGVIHTCDCLSVVFLNWTPMCWQGTRQDLWYVAMEMYLLCATKMHLCFELCTAECGSIESCSGEATPLIEQQCQMKCLCEVVFMQFMHFRKEKLEWKYDKINHLHHLIHVLPYYVINPRSGTFIS